jgi:dephospho-CoA kinase
MSTRPFHLGLTGGIGSGKSTVAAMLAELGAAVVDADAISRGVSAAGGSALPQIAAQFGAKALAADGGMDRAYMRQLIFSNPSAKAQLEAIIHPMVQQANAQAVAAAARAGQHWFVHDIPLLVESKHWRQRLSQVLVVDCTEATQVSRVQARNGLSEDAIAAVMAAQASRQQRLACADVVLHNDGIDLPQLKQALTQLAKRCQWV